MIRLLLTSLLGLINQWRVRGVLLKGLSYLLRILLLNKPTEDVLDVALLLLFRKRKREKEESHVVSQVLLAKHCELEADFNAAMEVEFHTPKVPELKSVEINPRRPFCSPKRVLFEWLEDSLVNPLGIEELLHILESPQF